MVGEWGLVEPVGSVLIAPFGDGAAVHDSRTATTHVLGPLGAWLMLLPDPTPVAELIGDLRDETGLDASEAERILSEAVLELADRGLLVDPKMEGPVDAVAPRSSERPIVAASSETGDRMVSSHGTSDRNGSIGPNYDVMGASIAFRAGGGDAEERAELLKAIDDHLGGGVEGETPDRVLEVESFPDGRVRLDVDGEWVFPTLAVMLAQLDQILDDAAGRIDPLLVLHAGCVRLSDGSLALVSGGSGSGRAEVLERLIRAGADYVSRGVIGIDPRDGSIRTIRRPFRATRGDGSDWMSDSSGRAGSDDPDGLAGTTSFQQVRPEGSISQLWLLRHDLNPTAARRTRLDPVGALTALSSVVAEPGRLDRLRFEHLCRLASTITVVDAVHADPDDLASRISKGSADRLALSVPERDLEPPPDLRPAPAPEVAVAEVRIDDMRLAFASTPAHRVILLDPVSAAVCRAADGETTVDDIAEELRGIVDPIEHPDPWPLAVATLVELADHGVIEALPSSWPVANGRGVVDHPQGPWMVADVWLLNDPPKCPGGFRAVELPGGPDNGVLVALDRSRRLWVETDEARRWLASRAAVSALRSDRWILSLPPIRVRRHADGVDVLLEPTATRCVGPNDSGAEAPSVRVDGERIVGAAVDRSGTLLVPRTDAMKLWNEGGSGLTAVSDLFDPVPVRSVMVPSEESKLGRWLRLFDQLLDSDSAIALSHLVRMADGRIEEPEVDSPDSSAVSHAGTGLVEHGPMDVGSEGPRPTVGDADGGATSLLRWANDIGATAFWDESVKIDVDKITSIRPLYRIDCRDLGGGDGASEEEMMERFAALGLDAPHRSEAAAIAATVGEFHIGEERAADGSWRRKLYVWTVSHDVRPQLSDSWNPLLIDTETAPSWVAWKFASTDPERVELAVDLPYLGSVERVDHAVAPMLERLPPAWSDAIDGLIDVAGIGRDRRPLRDDAITVELGGRFTVDLTVRGESSGREGWRFVGAVRWLAAVAGHGRRETDRLADWVAAGSMSNLIFGVDRFDRPFVNLYLRTGRPVVGLGWNVPDR